MSASVWAAGLHELDEVDSTNDEALRALSAGAPHGAVFVAARQRAGRGRRGRRWWLLPGEQLAMSIVLRLPWSLSVLPQLTLGAGVAVAEAVAQRWGVDLALKWPNDLVDRSSLRKVAGILCESVVVGGRLEGAVVGIGLNLHGRREDLPAELAETAISLSMLGCVIGTGERRALAIACAERLLWLTAGDETTAVTEIRRRWRQRSILPRPVLLADGRRGEAADIGEDGALQVVVDGAVRRVDAGEVEWLCSERQET